MAWNEHWSTSPPGALASIGWVSQHRGLPRHLRPPGRSSPSEPTCTAWTGPPASRAKADRVARPEGPARPASAAPDGYDATAHEPTFTYCAGGSCTPSTTPTAPRSPSASATTAPRATAWACGASGARIRASGRSRRCSREARRPASARWPSGTADRRLRARAWWASCSCSRAPTCRRSCTTRCSRSTAWRSRLPAQPLRAVSLTYRPSHGDRASCRASPS